MDRIKKYSRCLHKKLNYYITYHFNYIQVEQHFRAKEPNSL